MTIYKKVIIIVTCSMCIIAGGIGVYAKEELSGNQLNVQPNIDQSIVQDLNGVSLRFCNDTSGLSGINLTPRLYLTSQPGEVKKICTMFFNNLDKDVNFQVGFTEATKNKYNEWLCDDDSSLTNNFGKLIREDFPSMKIAVKSKMQAYQKFTLSIPKNTTGDIIGCLSYTIDGSYSKTTGAVFGVLIRKTAPIWIAVTGDVYNFGRRDDTKDIYTSNKSSILKVVAGILGLWIIVTIIQMSKKKEEKPHHKKK